MKDSSRSSRRDEGFDLELHGNQTGVVALRSDGVVHSRAGGIVDSWSHLGMDAVQSNVYM